MTFVSYYLFGFLQLMGWPRKKGIPFFRKNVVDLFILKMLIEQMTQFAILLGAIRPKIAISIIADMTNNRDRARKPAEELWAFLDPTKIVTSHPKLDPAEVITHFPTAGQDCRHLFPKDIGQHYVPSEFLMSEPLTSHSQTTFLRGLVWGFDHSQEALTAFEAKKKQLEKWLPEVTSGAVKLSLDPPYDCRTATPDEICNEIREVLGSFQKEIRPLSSIPDDLLSLPQVIQRLRE